MIYKIKRYSRELIRNHPEAIFVFGDNMFRQGMGGQAQAARYETNALGIVTKKSPDHTNEAFFYTPELKYYKWASYNDFNLLHMYAADKYDIVIPEDGIGTGLSRLQETAPNILNYIEEEFLFVVKLALNSKSKSFIHNMEDLAIFQNKAKELSLASFHKFVSNFSIVNAFDEVQQPYRLVMEDDVLSVNDFWLKHQDEETIINPMIWRDLIPYYPENI